MTHKITISGNGKLPPVLWVGASLNWNTPLTGHNQNWRKEMTSKVSNMLCSCGSVLSAVTFTCVRGSYCPTREK